MPVVVFSSNFIADKTTIKKKVRQSHSAQFVVDNYVQSFSDNTQITCNNSVTMQSVLCSLNKGQNAHEVLLGSIESLLCLQ